MWNLSPSSFILVSRCVHLIRWEGNITPPLSLIPSQEFFLKKGMSLNLTLHWISERLPYQNTWNDKNKNILNTFVTFHIFIQNSNHVYLDEKWFCIRNIFYKRKWELLKTVGTLIRIIWKIEGCPTLGMGLSLSSLNYTSEYWDRDNLNQYHEYVSLITRNMITPVYKSVVKYLGPANYTFQNIRIELLMNICHWLPEIWQLSAYKSLARYLGANRRLNPLATGILEYWHSLQLGNLTRYLGANRCIKSLFVWRRANTGSFELKLISNSAKNICINV